MLQAAAEIMTESENTFPSGLLSKPIFLDMDASAWGTWDGRLKLKSAGEALVAEFSNTGLYKYLYYTLTGPIDFQKVIFSLNLRFDEAAAASGHRVIFFNSLGDSWVSADKNVENNEADSEVIYSCTGFTQSAAPGQKFKIGLVFSASAGSVVVKDARLLMA